ncbi:RNA polymerase sigma factor [Polyangium aurulentum]|uniref:RNA polymerase sigma factor n=1 Tax=Polyangium aurulentum TaxID=2567896 RepID=UPI0010AE27E7|nr:sigma-70 family RNA polymerase sigma factor [Polyangium aurulentum]UQA57468.1 sigma-70 family RNA polymerase sigma factor [Polyangium aurulentum]
MGIFIPVPPGAAEAFLRFYATYLLTVFGILARIGVRKADIVDLAQQVFLKVYKNFEKVPAEGVEHWLETICKQQAAEHYRLYRHRFETPEPDVGVDVPSDDNPHERLERHEIDQVVKRVLQAMDAQLADVLVRHEFNGESLPTIATALGVSRNTAQARLTEAKDAFRRKVKKLFGRDFTPFALLPFGLDTFFRTEDLTPDFIENARREVWQGLGRELGFDGTLPPAQVPSPSPPSEPPTSGERLIQTVGAPGSGPVARAAARSVLEHVIKNPLFLVGVGALGGGGVVALWPHDEPPGARHAVPMVLSVVVDESGRGEGSSQGPHTPIPGPSPTVVIVAPPRPPPALAPFNDPEITNLEQAREMLTRGQFAEALSTLRQHERDYPATQHTAVRNKYIAAALAGVRQSEQKKSESP